MARAVGDTTLQWAVNSALVVTWATSGPDGAATGAFSGLSDAVNIASYENVLDVLVSGRIGLTATSSTNRYVGIFASAPNSGQYALGHGEITNMNQLPSISLDARSAFVGRAFSLAAVFGGMLPPAVKFAIDNEAGVTMGGTAGQAVQNNLTVTIVYANTKLS